MYPVDIRDALAVGSFTPRQFDWVFLDAAVELAAAQFTQGQEIARLAVIVVDGDQWTALNVAKASAQRSAARHEMRASS